MGRDKLLAQTTSTAVFLVRMGWIKNGASSFYIASYLATAMNKVERKMAMMKPTQL